MFVRLQMYMCWEWDQTAVKVAQGDDLEGQTVDFAPFLIS